MLAKITAYNGTIYKFATSTQDTNDGIYTGRIVEEIDFTSQSSDNGAAPNTINITIRNDDNFIPKNVDLWGATIDLTATNGKSWRGKITFFSFDADGNVYITATEKSLPELELQMPDEVRQVYTIDDNFHQSSQTMTIPLVVGGTHSSPISLPTILIDKQNGIYLICTGEIREIVAVYNGSEVLPRSAYIPYRGWPTQAEHPGFAYVQIEEPYRTNADGSYAEINVDVVGLKLGNHTEAECRNGARFLYYFLTTPATGVNGWGLGIDPSEIDTASFNTAITLCDASNFKLDGIMWLRQGADAWINQICQAIHGKYSININGKRTLTIDYAGAASKANFGPNDMRISRYGKNAYTGAIYNKGVFSYGYNPITGLFMQSAQYENSESVAQIGEQKFVGESYLINDAATALAVLEYTCKKSQIAAESIEFETDRLDTLLYAGDLITISRSDISISGTFQIKSISTSESKSIISASRFDSSVFIVGGTHTNINWNSEKPITPALTPAEATNLLLTTGFDINPDGTGTPYIKGTFTPPAGGWIAAAVQYGIGTNPANWTELALITNGQFVIQPVSVGAVYSVRVRMITATGHSDYVTGQITAAGDSVPPEIPTIAVNATDKSVIVQCAIDNPPYDMGGFQIHRKKHSESVYTLIGNVAANRGYASFADYVDEWVAYDYKAKSYDRSGNLSDFSDVKTVTVTGIQANDVAATALKIPTGSILRLSAKGCTTASIKQTTDSSGNPVYGVKDVSGYNHHGQAFGGVSVLDGGEGFAFDGANNSYINLAAMRTAFVGNLGGITLHARVKPSIVDTNERYIIALDIPNVGPLISIVNGYYNFGGRRIGTETLVRLRGSQPVVDKEITLTCVLDFENNKIYAYENGLLVAEGANASAGTFTTSTLNGVYVGSLYRGGANNYPFSGTIADVRIYPRALSATEVKSMYMLPDEAIFGQLNADLIGANVINASNLVKTQALITEAAQISQAVVNNLNVTGNATFQAGLNGIQVGGRNLITGSALATASNWDSTSNSSSRANRTLGPRSYGNGSVTRVSVSDSPVIGIGYAAKISGNTSGNKDVGQTFVALKANQAYTFSFWAKASVAVSAAHSLFRMYPDQTWHEAIPTTWKHFSFTFTTTSTADLTPLAGVTGVQEGDVYILGMKLEEGTRATDWTPAPEDTDASINAVQTNLNTVTNNIYAPNTTQINGGKIYTGSVDAYRIGANSIQAGCIETRHLTANAIVGKTFATAANVGSGTSGVRFNSSGIQGFNGSTKKFDLSTTGKLTCSDVDLTGKITATSGAIGDCQINTNNSDSQYCSLYLKTSKTVGFSVEQTTNNVAAAFSSNGRGVQIYAKADGAGDGLFVQNTGTGAAARIKNSGSGSGLLVGANTSSGTAIDAVGKAYCSSGAWSGSDINTKSQIKSESVLNRLKQIEVTSWKYDQDKIDDIQAKKDGTEYKSKNIGTKNQPKHFGAMAQEFNAMFGTSNGSSDSLCYTDTIGVCMRAIQELSEQLDNAVREIRRLKRILRANGTITDQIIAEDRDNEAIRRLTIAKARQAKREQQQDENTDSNTNNTNDDGLR